MKKYYLSKIKAVQHPDFGTVYRHRLQEISDTTPIDYEGGDIAVDPATGLPLNKFVLVLVGRVDHRLFRNDDELVPLPDVSRDMKISAIQTAEKVRVKRAIKKLGLTDAEIDEVWDNSDGLRDVLNIYGRKNNPDFDCDNFDLNDA